MKTPEEMDALTLAVMDSIEPRYQHDITIFARRYRKALAEKMEPVAWVKYECGIVPNFIPVVFGSVSKDISQHTPLYSLEDWKK